MATIPVERIAAKEERAVRLMYPPVVSITKDWSSAKSLTGCTDVILSPGGRGTICQKRKKWISESNTTGDNYVQIQAHTEPIYKLNQARYLTDDYKRVSPEKLSYKPGPKKQWIHLDKRVPCWSSWTFWYLIGSNWVYNASFTATTGWGK
jgi:hypothetical protein